MKTLPNQVIVGLLTVWLTSCSHTYKGELSDHYDGKKFYNPGKPMEKGFSDFLKWRLNSDKGPWPEFTELEVFDRPPRRVEGDSLRISFVGHSTVLIQTQGLNILTDPIWSDRASIVQWAGPKRVHPPGILWQDLPPIHVVLISHNHYDHLDLSTLKGLHLLKPKPRIIVPLGNKSILAKAGIEAEEYDWHERVQINEEVVINLEPMQHWSARSLFDRNKALWASYVIQTGAGNIYFVGDSGYGDGENFRAVLSKYSSFRFAIVPMGSYDPEWFMSYGHMNPQELLHAFEDLGRPFLLPTHHMVFPLADTAYGEPEKELKQAMDKNMHAKQRIKALTPGQSWKIAVEEAF